MSQSEKAALFRKLKEAGVTFDQHYREYKTADLQAAWDKLQEQRTVASPQPAPQPVDEPEFDEGDQPMFELPAEDQPQQAAPRPRPQIKLPETRRRDETEMAGQRLNTQADDEPIRRDPDTGFLWYQEEVRKPAYPKPRGRRILQYQDKGTKRQTVKNGEYLETFEVDGDGAPRTGEIKITLPSYQVGLYKDPRFPFRIYVYNENRGFHLFEVQKFYGGSELVPPEIKRVYVENVLCYDIRTTIQAIQREHRQLQLAGKVK